MADFKLSSPRVRIVRGAIDAPEVIEVQTLTPDLILWDMTYLKHRWPSFKDAPIKWLTFIAWAACRREGRIPADLSPEAWEASALDVSVIDDDEADEDAEGATDPTPPGLGPGLSAS